MADTVLKLDPEIIVGVDAVTRAGSLCSKLGSKVFVASEQGLYENKLIERLIRVLEDAGLETILFDEIPAQATADVAETAASLARGARCDMVVGFGGPKTQHIARLVSVLAASPLGVFELFDGMKEENSFLPYAAVPCAGGDPFLLTDNVIAVDPRDKFAKLIKCPKGLCQTVILDPGVSEQLSGKFASTAAFDGLCVVLETYCSVKSSFLSDALLEHAAALYAGMIHSYAGNLVSGGEPRSLQTPAAGSDFPSVSVNAGFLLSLGATVSSPGIGTALAYALNGKFPVAKSWCATVLLPYVMEKLVAVRPEKMAKMAAVFGESVEGVSTAEAADMAVDFVRRRMGQFQVPARLKDFNLSLDRLVPVAEAARKLEFVAFSPWTVASEDAYDILKQAF